MNWYQTDTKLVQIGISERNQTGSNVEKRLLGKQEGLN
jgi:hypothetical protein